MKFDSALLSLLPVDDRVQGAGSHLPDDEPTPRVRCSGCIRELENGRPTKARSIVLENIPGTLEPRHKLDAMSVEEIRELEDELYWLRHCSDK